MEKEFIRKIYKTIDKITFVGALAFIIASGSFMMIVFYSAFLNGHTVVNHHLNVFSETYIEVIILSFLWLCLIYQGMKHFKPKVERILESEVAITLKQSYIGVFIIFVMPVAVVVILSIE